MTVSKQALSDQLVKYLNHKISKEELIDWCEKMMQEANFEEIPVKESVARIGLSDAQNFDMSYEELYEMLQKLGYRLKVELVS
jgi:arsenate reductase-like glutaredoxin family protein